MLSLFCGGKNDDDVHEKEAYEKAAKSTNGPDKEAQTVFFRERKLTKTKNKKFCISTLLERFTTCRCS